MKELIVSHITNQYKDLNTKTNIWFDGNIDYRLEIARAIYSVATNKASGIENILGELYRNRDARLLIKDKIEIHFSQYLFNSDVPDYFMLAKLVLISKDGTDHPTIDKTISILPSITKLLCMFRAIKINTNEIY